jgi:hypothetical protein
MTPEEEQEEHDAMMRAFHGVPLAHKLETMPDIDLAELQSHLASNSPGKIIIDNEWQRRILSKTTSKTPKITRKSQNTFQKIKDWYQGNEAVIIPVENGNFVDIYVRYEKSTSARVANGLVIFWFAHWQWLIGTFVAICIGLVPLFIYLDTKAEKKASNQISPTRQQSSQTIIHNQSSSSRPVTRPQR